MEVAVEGSKSRGICNASMRHDKGLNLGEDS